MNPTEARLIEAVMLWRIGRTAPNAKEMGDNLADAAEAFMKEHR